MNEKGFTLIELFIVSGIILALVAFSTPLFRKTFNELQLREAASNISKLAAFAQQEAILNRNTYKISFNPEKRTYQLLSAGSQEGAKVEFKPSGGRFGRVFHWPGSIDMEAQLNEGRSVGISFYPDGHSDKAEFKLANKNDKVLRITSTGVLGNIAIYEEQP